jgi:hypothetical protein
VVTGAGAPPARDRALPLSLEQISAARPRALATWKHLVEFPMGASPDETALVRALALVVGRHEPLRMRLVHRRPRPDGTSARRKKGQRFAPPADRFPLEVRRCAARAAAEQAVDEFFERDMDLVQDGPVRAGLFGVDGHEAKLMLVVHHLAWDGLSLIPFERELRAAYEAFAAGTEPELPALRGCYSDHVIEQYRAGPRLTPEQASYWDGIFRGWEPGQALGLPAAFAQATLAARPGASGVWDAALAGELPGGLEPRVQRAARAMRVTSASVWLAAVLVSLWSQHDHDSVCVYWVHHGRDRGEFVDLVGFFSRLLPVRVRLDPQQRFDELCVEVFSQVRSAIRHSAAPWSLLRLGEHLLGPRNEAGADGDRPRMARVAVNIYASGGMVQGASEAEPEQAGPDASGASVSRPGQLWFHLFLGGEPAVYAEFDRRAFPDPLAGAYLGGLAAIMQAMAVARPQPTLGALRDLARQHVQLSAADS